MINRLRGYRNYLIGRWRIRRLVAEYRKKSAQIKIIVGSGGTSYEGWIPTDIPHFDITKADDWRYFFKEGEISNILAEHVLEHLTTAQINLFLKSAYPFLKRGGKIRIAVPDEFNRDPIYYEGVKPNGNDVGSDDHKVFLNTETAAGLARHNGYAYEALEHYDINGKFNSINFLASDGYITRSKMNRFSYPPIPKYSSLIFDLKKL